MAIWKPFFKGWGRAHHSSGEENKVACVSGKIHIQVSHRGEMERRFMLCHRTRSSLYKTQNSLGKCLETSSLSGFLQTAKCRHFFLSSTLQRKKKKVSGGKISTDVSSSRVVRGLPLPEERGNSQRERNKSFWKKKTPARRYFPYHFNHKIARMRSVPACYPNVDLNTTERWFENFHFCNLLSFVKPRLERNLAAVCKSGTISLPTHSVGGDVEGTAQERREREGGGLRGARPPPGPAEEARAASQPGGWLHLQESEGTRSGSLCRRGNQSGGLGQLLENFPASRNGVWGAGGKESGGRDRHHQLHSGMSDPAQGLVLREEKRLHASRITHDGFRA